MRLGFNFLLEVLTRVIRIGVMAGCYNARRQEATSLQVMEVALVLSLVARVTKLML